jgi:hypothetical protein
MSHMLIGSLLGFLVVSAALAQSGDTVGAPALKPGDSWTYTQIDKLDRSRNAKFAVTVKSVSERGHEVSRQVLEGTLGGTDDQYTYELNPIVLEGQKYEPFIPAFSFPLAPGKKWEGKFSFWISSGSLQFTATRSSHVEGWESVRTPAGDFKALKITFHQRAMNQFGRGTEIQGTLWYSPDVRRFVRTELRAFGGAPRDQVIELVGFKPAN